MSGHVSLRAYLAVMFAVALYAAPARAYPGNKAGSFGYPTGSIVGSLDGTCGGCHTMTGQAPSQVLLNGHSPTQAETVQPGQTIPLAIAFTPGAGKPQGGILVAHFDTSDDDAHGTLIQGSNTHACKGPEPAAGSGSQCHATLPFDLGKLGNTEITQEAPVVAASGQVSFSFSYRAPTQCGTFKFRALIANVNGNIGCGSGDFGAAPTDFSIDVPCPDLCMGVTCPAAGACHAAGVCNPATGVCSNPSLPDGSTCTGQDRCLQNYQCSSGACVGSNPVSCGAPVQCAQASRCNSTTGTCDPPAPQGDGASCDDGDPCTVSDRCASGACIPGLPLICNDPQTCFNRAACDRATGRCGSEIPTASGVACDDHIDSTRGDVCNGAGSCGGTPLPSNMYGWGANSNTGASSPTASNLSTANRFIQVAVGNNHVVGLRADGTVMSWGENVLGQLGLGTTSATPTRTPSLVNLNSFMTSQFGGSRVDGVVQVAAGNGYTIALIQTGHPIAWGASDKGQTGVVSTVGVATPRWVNLGFIFTAIAAGTEHVLGLSVDGRVYSWGSSALGELGRPNNGSGFDATPQVVPGLDNVIAIAAGGATSLALRVDGTVWAWGTNAFGHLGTGTSATASSSPVQVAGLTGVAKIASSQFHDLALLSDGTVRAWGLNAFGELGIADTGQTTNAALARVGVGASSQVAVNTCTTIANLLHIPAILQPCVGIAQQLGVAVAMQISNAVNTGVFRASPVQVAGLTNVISVAAGAYHSTAIIDDGRVMSWGSNSNGQLGLPTTGAQMSTFSVAPVAQPTMSETVFIAAGASQSVALKAATATIAWGRNTDGQVGSGSSGESELPGFIPNFGNARTIAAGGHHTLAIRGDGTVWAWGQNIGGELGTSSTQSELSPVQVLDSSDPSGKLRHAVAVSAGARHNLVLKSDGTVWAWGNNEFGQVTGAFPDQKNPLKITDSNGTLNWGGDGKLVRIIAVSCGANHSLALADDGTLWAWGQNIFGQVGTGSTANAVRSPFRLTGTGDGVQKMGPLKMISGGKLHSLGLTPEGTRWAWGEGEFGALGAVLSKSYFAPTPGGASSRDPHKFIVAGDRGSMGIDYFGSGGGWGVSTDGQLGVFFFYSPFSPAGMDNVGITMKLIAAGSVHSLELDTSGRVLSTGSNAYGQLGRAASLDKLATPVPIHDLNGAQSIAAGEFHSLALLP